MDRLDCSVFADQLDALVQENLTEDGVGQLPRHAAVCRECEALLRVKKHLVSLSLEALEERVPDQWVASMHADVRSALGVGRDRARPRIRWIAPALAAASVVLLLVNGLTLRSLGRAHVRERDLVQQVLDQQRRLVEAEVDRATAARPARALRNSSLRALGPGGDLTLEGLRTLLGGLPSETPVFDASHARVLAVSRRVPAAWQDVLARLDDGSDVTAGELLNALEGLDLPGDTTVPTTRLLDLLS